MMTRMLMRGWKTLAVLTIASSLVVQLGVASAGAAASSDESGIRIESGYDIFRTTGAGKDFSESPIPGFLFGPGSSDFSGLLVLEGKPLTEYMGFPLPTPSEAFPENQVDTIVHRKSEAILTGVGSEVTIPIEMVALSLRSVAAIEIRNSSNETEYWDVVISASDNPEGTMTLRQETRKGGTYDAIVPVDGVFTFTRRGDGAVRVLDAAAVGMPTLIFEIVSSPWMSSVVEPPPTDNFLVTKIPGLTTDFVPGYSETKGRTNICGVNPSFVWHPRGPGTGWHGHVVVSYTPTDFFPHDACRALEPPVVPGLTPWGFVTLGALLAGLMVVTIRRLQVTHSSRA